jgi:hypothetical protein
MEFSTQSQTLGYGVGASGNGGDGDDDREKKRRKISRPSDKADLPFSPADKNQNKRTKKTDKVPRKTAGPQGEVVHAGGFLGRRRSDRPQRMKWNVNADTHLLMHYLCRSGRTKEQESIAKTFTGKLKLLNSSYLE